MMRDKQGLDLLGPTWRGRTGVTPLLLVLLVLRLVPFTEPAETSRQPQALRDEQKQTLVCFTLPTL